MLLLLACVAPDREPEARPRVPDTGAEADTAEMATLGDAPEPEEPAVAAIVAPASGLFDAPFTATLTLPASGGEVRYTLDGSDPIDGLVYTGPLAVVTTTVLRATVLVGGVPVVPTETVTWLFPAHVPDQQRPVGWPAEWWTDEPGGPYAADYTLDPEVTESAVWATAGPTLFTDLPVLSLVLDPDDLFDERLGIHENPLETGDDWERPAVATLLAVGETFTINCGVRVHGGSGRFPEKTPKKAFRLAFRGEYGAGELEHRVFPDSDVASFDTLVLRAGYNRSWAHAEPVSRTRADYVRERFGHEVYRRMGHVAPHVRHVHLLLDGLYWGLYQVEERPDADFLAAHLGGSADEWDVVDAGELVDGDGASWQALQDLVDGDLSDPARYAAVEALLDLDAFADYLLVNLSLGNIDWPDRNWWAGRRRADGERWRFVTWDNEYLLVEPEDVDLTVDWPDSPGEMFQALRANEEFRVRFGDRVQRHHFGAGALTAGVLVELFETLADSVVPGVIGESARWGDHWRDVRGASAGELYTYERHWLAERARITTDYLVNRGAYAVAAYQAAGLYPTVAAPTVAPFGGVVPEGTVVTLAGSGQVLYTLDGTDPRAPGGAVADGALLYAGRTVLETSATLRARVLDAGGWSALVEVGFTVE